MKESPYTPESMPPFRRVLVVPGARVVRDSFGQYHMPLISPGNTSSESHKDFEVSGGESRMAAAAQIFTPDAHVFVTGGSEKDLAVSRSDIMRQKLVESHGLPPDKVTSIGKDGSTVGNAVDLAKFILAHPEQFAHIDEIELVENEYKMLRAWMFFSATMHRICTGRDLKIPAPEKATILKLLQQPLTNALRLQIMNIVERQLSPHALRIKPVYVEEILERVEPTLTRDIAQKRYAAMIRSNPHVQWRAQTSEVEGVIAFMNGLHRGQENISALSQLRNL